MKTFAIFILILFWGLFTTILALSVVGLMVFLIEDNKTDKILWFSIGEELIKKL